ncbi:hypothetical protein ACN4EK_03445 [Pantanalinema rosaneae CENA516]|uniref:hypothetical protein n=1 Tax=Pantanalinema rosaneae TaxID=1620701 RepID=UPI003D6F1C97
MSRRKKHSSAGLEKAQTRLASLKSISPALDLGNGLTIAAFTQIIEDARQKLESYNTSLSAVDQTYTAMEDAEEVMAEWTERMLIGVASKYGKNSDEYKMAGGTRRVERKRPQRRNSQEAFMTRS